MPAERLPRLTVEEFPATAFRVGRRSGVIHFAEIDVVDAANIGQGGRFDVAGGGVLYCVTTKTGAYKEVLAQFRPSAKTYRIMSDMRRAQSTSHSIIAVLIVVAVLCVFPAASMVLSQYFDTRENVSSRCFLDDHQDDVAMGENTLIEAHVTSIPAGRLCIWDGVDGGEVTHQTGWFFTVMSIIASAAGLVVLVALQWTIRSLRARLLAALPFLVTIGLWLIVMIYGATMTPFIR